MAEPAQAGMQKKICMLGSYAVGKTSLVRRFVEGIFDERYLTTVGVKIDRKRIVIGGRELNLILWDLAGDDDLGGPKPSYLRGSAGYIVVADGCRRSTVDNAIAVQERAASISGPVPVVFAFNKADLKPDWEVGEADAKRVSENGWTPIYTSAKTGAGVEALFTNLAEKLLVDADEHTAT
jgi:small GTP-binding protein